MLEITRRGLLKRTLLAGGAFAASAILAACGSAPPTPAKPAEPAKAAEAPKPAETPKAAEAPKAAEPAKAAEAPKPSPPAPPTPVAATRQLLKAPETNPKRGGTLKTAFGVTVGHFDFHQGGGGPLVHAFDNLVMLNPQDGFKTIIPELAESWELSSDGKSYTFKVRDGVKFHD